MEVIYILHKKALKIFFSVCLSGMFIISLFFFIHNIRKNKAIEKNLLSKADTIISGEVVNNKENDIESKELENESFSIEKLEEDDNIVGKIIINKINVVAPVMDGVDQDTLKMAVGHFIESSYWKGNVCLASHNRGSYAHYFEKINALSIGDEIKYQTKLGTRIYVVTETKQISEEDLSVLDNTNENTITLITCVKSKPELRLCVKGIEKNI